MQAMWVDSGKNVKFNYVTESEIKESLWVDNTPKQGLEMYYTFVNM